MALADGVSNMRSVPELSKHTKTLIALLPMFNEEIKIETE